MIEIERKIERNMNKQAIIYRLRHLLRKRILKCFSRLQNLYSTNRYSDRHTRRQNSYVAFNILGDSEFLMQR